MSGIVTVPAGLSNVHLVPLARGLMIVDTGYPLPRLPERILGAAQALGYSPRQVQLILLTHGHVDHAGNAARLRRMTGAPIALHPADGQMAQRGGHGIPEGRGPRGRVMAATLSRLPILCRFEPFTPDVWLEEGQGLADLGVEGYVIHTPGHSAGSVSLLLEEGEALIGDALVHQGRVSFPLYWENREQAQESALKLARLKPETLHTGHGTRFGRDELEQFVERWEAYENPRIGR